MKFLRCSVWVSRIHFSILGYKSRPGPVGSSLVGRTVNVL